MRLLRLLFVVALCTAILGPLKTVASSNSSPQHIAWLTYESPNATPPEYWNGTQTGNYNYDFFLSIDALGDDTRSMYWAHQFRFRDSGDFPVGVGYTGFQVLADGTRAVVFSIWGGEGDSANYPYCAQYGQQANNSAHCITEFDWQTGRTYRFRVW